MGEVTVVCTTCGGTMWVAGSSAFGGRLRTTSFRCEKCGRQEVYIGPPPNPIDTLAAAEVERRATQNPMTFLRRVAKAAGLTMRLCGWCSRPILTEAGPFIDPKGEADITTGICRPCAAEMRRRA